MITPEMIRAQSGEAAQLLTKLNKLDRNSREARKIRRQLRKLGVRLSGTKDRTLGRKSWKEKIMEQIEKERTFPSGAVSLRKLTKREKKLRRDKKLGFGKYGLEERERKKKAIKWLFDEREKIREKDKSIKKSLRTPFMTKRQREKVSKAIQAPHISRRRQREGGERLDQVLDTAQQLVLAGYKKDEQIASRLLELYPKIEGERAIVAARKALFKKNPPSGPKEIYGRILAIEARKGPQSNYPNENFRHDFKPGAKIFGLPDGSILIKGKKKLWNEF